MDNYGYGRSLSFIINYLSLLFSSGVCRGSGRARRSPASDLNAVRSEIYIVRQIYIPIYFAKQQFNVFSIFS